MDVLFESYFKTFQLSTHFVVTCINNFSGYAMLFSWKATCRTLSDAGCAVEGHCDSLSSSVWSRCVLSLYVVCLHVVSTLVAGGRYELSTVSKL